MEIQKWSILLSISILMIGVFTGISSGEDISFNITPDNPVKGDIITVTGYANPNGLIKAAVTFEGELQLKNGEYTLSVEGIDIPFEDIKFTAFVYGCKTLELSGRKPMWGELYTPWVTLSTNAVDGVATLSYSIPPGTYDASIHITSDKSNNLKVKIIASGLIKTDENGKFSYSYDTSLGIPGDVKISIGGESKIITLSEPKKETPHQNTHHKTHHHSTSTPSNQQTSNEIDNTSNNDTQNNETQIDGQIDETQDKTITQQTKEIQDNISQNTSQIDEPQNIIEEKPVDQKIAGPISIGDSIGNFVKEISKAIGSFFQSLKSLF